VIGIANDVLQLFVADPPPAHTAWFATMR